jgi:GDP/UDP-N,N'-diacetylbacillosamine 2-epimerase (hydrolysing)
MKRKVIYVSGTRADYGLMRRTLAGIVDSSELELTVIATGMHLMPEFGLTVNEIAQDGFSFAKVEARYQSDDKKSMARFIGEFILGFTEIVTRLRPDFILVLGDRAEALGAAIVGCYLSIPVCHIHGGDVTSTVDEHARHAITKLANIHFAGSKQSASNIVDLLHEDPKRVFMVGSPALDELRAIRLKSKSEISKGYGLDQKRPYVVFVQHPVTSEWKQAGQHARITLKALLRTGVQIIAVYPNADAGGRKIISVIDSLSAKSRDIHVFRSLPRPDYLSLLKHSEAIVGNSSSGIVEAGALGIPAINIGARQKGREHDVNVQNVNNDEQEIFEAVSDLLTDPHVRKRLRRKSKIYGDGRSSERIVKVLENSQLSPSDMQKKLI